MRVTLASDSGCNLNAGGPLDPTLNFSRTGLDLSLATRTNITLSRQRHNDSREASDLLQTGLF